HLVEDVDLLAVRIVDGVVVDGAEGAVRLVDGEERIELVVQAALVVDLRRGAPGGAAVRGAREPDARLAGRRRARAGLVRRRGAAAVAGEVGPERVDVVRRAVAVRAAGDVDEDAPAGERRDADVIRVERGDE